MTVEADLTTVLKTLCPRVYADFAPVNTTRPYITFQQVGGEAPTFMGREVPSKENCEFQINVWASSRAAAKALIKQVESALTLATVFQAKPMGAAISDFDADVPVFGSLQTFSVWSDR